MTNAQVKSLMYAAKIVAVNLRNRQAQFLKAAVGEDAGLASILRSLAKQDGEMAELLELALKEESA